MGDIFDNNPKSQRNIYILILTDPFAGLSLDLEDESDSASTDEEADGSKGALEEAIAAIPLVLSNPTSRYFF